MLCYESIERPSDGLTTGACCKHSFHTDCVAVRLNVDNTRTARVYLQTKCPACDVTDNKVVSLLESIDGKLEGFGAQLTKVVTEVKALRTDLNKLTANQATTDAKVEALSARTDDLENRLEAVETNAAETSLSAADEAVLLRAACDQVAHQLVVSGLPEADGEDVKELSRSLVEALDPTLGGDEIVDAFRIGKRRRPVDSRRSGIAGPRSVIISLKSKGACKKVIEAKKGKPDLNAMQLDQSLPEVKLYVNFRQPAQLHQLRDCVLKALPNVDRKHIWISDGAVFLRKSKDDRPVKILPSTNLRQLSI